MTEMINSDCSVIGNGTGGLSIASGVVQMEALTSPLVVVSRTVRHSFAGYLIMRDATFIINNPSRLVLN